MSTENPWDKVTLKMWYDGTFKRNDNGMSYLGPRFTTLEVDPDELCWFTLLEGAEKCGKFDRTVDAIYYKKPDCNFEDGLVRVHDDFEAREICEIALEKRVVECYVMLEVNVPELVSMLEGKEQVESAAISKKLTPRRKLSSEVRRVQAVLKKRPLESNSKLKSPSKTRRLADKNPTLTTVNESVSLSSHRELSQSYDTNDVTVACIFNEDDGYELENEEDLGHSEDLFNNLQVGSGKVTSEGNGENEHVRYLILHEGNDTDEMLVENEVGSEDNTNALTIAENAQKKAVPCLLPDQQQQTHRTSVIEQVSGDYVNVFDASGEEIVTRGESEDECGAGNSKMSSVPIVNESTDYTKLKWCLGIRFPNRVAFKECVTRYAVVQGRNLVCIVSDKGRGQRLGVRCVKGCPFYLYGSWDNKMGCFLLKTVKHEHTCHRIMETNRQLKSTWLAQQFLEVFKTRPHWPASEIIETVRSTFKVSIKKGFAYKVKYHAHRLLHGSSKEHHSKVGIYLNPPPIKVGPVRDPHEDPKNNGKLKKHGILMTCSICKSKTHNKRKCPEKGKVLEPPPKRGKGRPMKTPRSDPNHQGTSQQLQSEDATANFLQAPIGLGVLFGNEEEAFTNVLGSFGVPMHIS